MQNGLDINISTLIGLALIIRFVIYSYKLIGGLHSLRQCYDRAVEQRPDAFLWSVRVSIVSLTNHGVFKLTPEQIRHLASPPAMCVFITVMSHERFGITNLVYIFVTIWDVNSEILDIRVNLYKSIINRWLFNNGIQIQMAASHGCLLQPQKMHGGYDDMRSPSFTMRLLDAGHWSSHYAYCHGKMMSFPTKINFVMA